MATTYTQNFHLGMQEDKSDKLNWDLIVQNWKIIDAALANQRIAAGDAIGVMSGTADYVAGQAVPVEE